MLNFCHLELSDPQQCSPRGDLVSKPDTDLGSSEGKPSPVVLEQFGEVDEHSLGGLGAKVSCEVGAGSNFGFEHEVEGFRFGESISSL